MPLLHYSNDKIAQALVNVIGDSHWEAVSYAHGYIALKNGLSKEQSARLIYERGPLSLKRSIEVISFLESGDFIDLLSPREKVGSAENPVTKLFPATITEQRFIELLDDIKESRPSVSYTDDRETGHTLTDFTLYENGYSLPINIKNAGTRFEKSYELVGLEPNDCIPIPAYKAHAAVDSVPNLLYVVSVDYDLIKVLNGTLSGLLNEEENIVWFLLNKYSGSKVRNGEDAFIFSAVKKYWDKISPIVACNPFNAISARKTVRILHNEPKRTPGIGLRAWGTGASAEVNVHVSINNDMTEWDIIKNRIIKYGIIDIIEAVNRKRTEIVYDPEI